MKKYTFKEFRQQMTICNGTSPVTGVIVFTETSFNRLYDLKSRSYRVSSENKAFNPSCISSSMYGSCLDGTDNGVRLDLYMNGEWGNWKVEYCYFD